MSDTQVTVACSSCAFSAQSWPALREHYRAQHDYCQTYDCKECDNFFIRPQELKSHLLTVHHYIQCPQCPKIFRYQGRLQQHLRIEHNLFTKTKRNPYQDLKSMTDNYIHKIRGILVQDKCENLGVLHTSLQRYITSDALTKAATGQDSQMAVLAFVMHAAEIALVERPSVDPRTAAPQPTTIASSLQVNKPRDQPSVPIDPPVIVLKTEPPGEKPAELTPKVKSEPTKIFITENVDRPPPPRKQSSVDEEPRRPQKRVRKESKAASHTEAVQIPVQIPETPLPSNEEQTWSSMYQFFCDACEKEFSSRAEVETHKYQVHPRLLVASLEQQEINEPVQGIHCIYGECPEQFEDNNELLAHLRTAHNS